jgi:hypothetical protein
MESVLEFVSKESPCEDERIQRALRKRIVTCRPPELRCQLRRDGRVGAAIKVSERWNVVTDRSHFYFESLPADGSRVTPRSGPGI